MYILYKAGGECRHNRYSVLNMYISATIHPIRPESYTSISMRKETRLTRLFHATV